MDFFAVQRVLPGILRQHFSTSRGLFDRIHERLKIIELARQLNLSLHRATFCVCQLKRYCSKPRFVVWNFNKSFCSRIENSMCCTFCFTQHSQAGGLILLCY